MIDWNEDIFGLSSGINVFSKEDVAAVSIGIAESNVQESNLMNFVHWKLCGLRSSNVFGVAIVIDVFLQRTQLHLSAQRLTEEEEAIWTSRNEEIVFWIGIEGRMLTQGKIS
jgi:hypothetical protein